MDSRDAELRRLEEENVLLQNRIHGSQGRAERNRNIAIAFVIIAALLATALMLVVFVGIQPAGEDGNARDQFRPVSVQGSLDDLNATGDITIIIYVNRTVAVETEVTMAFKHKRCDESREWEIQFKTKLEVNQSYAFTIIVNGMRAIDEEHVFIVEFTSPTFKVWLDGTWKGTIT